MIIPLYVSGSNDGARSDNEGVKWINIGISNTHNKFQDIEKAAWYQDITVHNTNDNSLVEKMIFRVLVIEGKCLKTQKPPQDRRKWIYPTCKITRAILLLVLSFSAYTVSHKAPFALLVSSSHVPRGWLLLTITATWIPMDLALTNSVQIPLSDRQETLL